MSIGSLAAKGVKSIAKPVGELALKTAKTTGKAVAGATWQTAKFGGKQFAKALKANPLGTLGFTAATALGVPVVAAGTFVHKTLFDNASSKDIRTLEKQLEAQAKQLDYLHGKYIEHSVRF